MSIEFQCSTCGKVLKTSDDRAGAMARCPQCGEAVTVPQPGNAVPVETILRPPFPAAESTEPEPQRHVAMRACPMCGEDVPVTAGTCGFCGERLAVRGNRSARQFRGPETPGIADLGAVFDDGLYLFQTHLGVGVGMSATIGGVFFVMYVATVVGLSILDSALTRNLDRDIQAIVMFSLGGSMLLSAILIYAWLEAGMYHAFMKASYGEKPAYADLFRGGRFLLGSAPAVLLFSLMATFGLVCLVPGLAVIVFLGMYPSAIVDRQVGFVRAFLTSYSIARRNLVPALMVGLVSFGLNVSVTMCGCLSILILFTMPYNACLNVSLYRHGYDPLEEGDERFSPEINPAGVSPTE